MPGLELIKNLAELDRELTEKVAGAHWSAEQRLKRAEAESQRLLAEAEAQIRQMEEASRTHIAAASAKLAEDARQRAAAAQERLRAQGLANLEKAVAFILSEIMP
jgi:vacuolar-type H+-ATPase subunit H